MKTKTEEQRFVFPDMSYQDFPLTTTADCAVVSKDLDLSGQKYLAGELVPKTSEELQVGAQAKLEAQSLALQQELGKALDLELDSKANLFGYDGIKTAVTYADEPIVPKFQAEGIEFRKWRSLCYAYAYEQLELHKLAGTSPAIEDFLAGLPALNLTLPV